MVLYLNTFQSLENYKNELKNCYITNNINGYNIKFPILLYSSIFSLIGLTFFVDDNNNVNIPLSNNNIYINIKETNMFIYSGRKYNIIFDKKYEIYFNNSIIAEKYIYGDLYYISSETYNMYTSQYFNLINYYFDEHEIYYINIEHIKILFSYDNKFYQIIFFNLN